jgi:hypothetical protein
MGSKAFVKYELAPKGEGGRKRRTKRERRGVKN